VRLTCSSLSLYSAPPAEAITAIAELGFPALDLVSVPTLPPPHLDVARRDPTELRQLARITAEAGVEVATVVALPSDGLPHWDDAEIGARVDWAVKACGALGTRRLVLDAGNPIPGKQVGRPEAICRWRAMVHTAFELTSAAGVLLAIEAPHTGTLAERFDEVGELLTALDLPEVGIDYDTSHVHRSGTSIEESLELVGPRLVKVALRDVGPDGEFCRPGEGVFDFPRLFALLNARQYAGDVVIELETPGVTRVPDQLREIELARAYVQGLLPPP
jgi:sugar phosphate isomerase/epimerase